MEHRSIHFNANGRKGGAVRHKSTLVHACVRALCIRVYNVHIPMYVWCVHMVYECVETDRAYLRISRLWTSHG